MVVVLPDVAGTLRKDVFEVGGGRMGVKTAAFGFGFRDVVVC
jgi:hypothetical protein